MAEMNAAAFAKDNHLFAVEPKTDCPHIPIQYEVKELLGKPCEACGDTTENWQCFHCQGIFCSRYCQGHMKQHTSDTHHAVCISHSDLSVWCFKCDTYIAHEDLKDMINCLYKLKFGE
ncbi:hypothetical protein EDC96DRAFT_611997 [Choanephora cucurbitarum]|uniref:UBP-type domain-containing protein n=1 Tax=Choanephora cucurbitarum TaxID=101091 RepID=A0A1C7N113_9FUNG|nr:hypothetical protein EDC96DRAFT_611997 [Choanephora cucurbitarum]OBZ82678.1 hypothetical protein A0J61_09272 [Choanephora cucurbitarum]